MGLVYQDKSGAIIRCNCAAEQILGMTEDQMKGISSMDPLWKAIRKDGSELQGAEHPSMLAMRTRNIIKDFIMGISHLGAITWLSVNAYPTTAGVECTFEIIENPNVMISDIQS